MRFRQDMLLLAAAAIAALALPTAHARAADVASLGAASAPTGAPVAPPHGRHRAHTAIATWFGPGFYGGTTACGQKLTPDVVGVANRTLACGTLVRVSYKGRSLTLAVIDRGPYGGIGATWDLTAGAARALGVNETVRISAKVVGSTADTPSLGQPAAVTPAPAAAASSATGGAAAG